MVIVAACGGSSAGPRVLPPTLRTVNRAHYQIVCNPVCSPAQAVPELHVGIWPRITSPDTMSLVDVVAFDSTSCVRLPAAVMAQRQLVRGAGLYGPRPLYYATNGAIDLSAHAGWEWIVTDSVKPDAYGVYYRGTFQAAPACVPHS
ncbi:MAG: hypothetical protein DMD60_14205 [Gemmatimonadetes bacterium]|nr:MAG: hypothetical protein DMD60_14205 [Gemmatimonadota bacterium]